jgi:hypothetical protein
MEEFRANRLLKGEEASKALRFGMDQLGLVQRQASIRQMFPTSRQSVMEEVTGSRGARG